MFSTLLMRAMVFGAALVEPLVSPGPKSPAVELSKSMLSAAGRTAGVVLFGVGGGVNLLRYPFSRMKTRVIEASKDRFSGKAAEPFQLTRYYQNPRVASISEIAGGYIGFHGTTLKNLKKQLETGEFEDRGNRLYIADLSTATFYAMNRSQPGDTPVVLRVRSAQQPEWNDIFGNGDGWGACPGGKGLYQYFVPGKAPVIIEVVYTIENNTSMAEEKQRSLEDYLHFPH